MKYSNYLNYLLDKPLNAKSMVTTLSILLKSETVTEMSIKQLIECLVKSGEDHNYEDYDEFNRLRYDFVDLTHRRIYEFDGDQHFDENNYFNETYEKYIDGVDRDLLKQRIAKQLEFDIVRVSGVLNVIDFISILKRLNLEKGQSLFIRDTYYEVIKSSLLKESSEIDLLEEIANLKLDVKRLSDENRKLKNLYKNHVKQKETVNNENIRLQDVSDKELVDLFFFEILEDIRYHEVVPIQLLYYKFIDWLKVKKHSLKLKRDKFTLQFFSLVLTSLENKYDFNVIRQRTTHKSYRYINTLLSHFEDQQQFVINRQISISFRDFVTTKDVSNFKKLNHPVEELSNKQKLIIDIIKYEEQNNVYSTMYGNNKKDDRLTNNLLNLI